MVSMEHQIAAEVECKNSFNFNCVKIVLCSSLCLVAAIVLDHKLNVMFAANTAAYQPR